MTMKLIDETVTLAHNEKLIYTDTLKPLSFILGIYIFLLLPNCG
jgi:hypothetical protein